MLTNYKMPLSPVIFSSSTTEFSVFFLWASQKHQVEVNKCGHRRKKQKFICHFSILLRLQVQWYWYFWGGSEVKKLPAKVGDAGLIHGLGRSPGRGNGNALQYSCLGHPMDRGAWRATVHGIARVRHDWATKYACLDLQSVYMMEAQYYFLFWQDQ